MAHLPVPFLPGKISQTFFQILLDYLSFMIYNNHAIKIEPRAGQAAGQGR
nr:MAG TPA: hypothetical protein [Caudoviricetes sp.]